MSKLDRLKRRHDKTYIKARKLEYKLELIDDMIKLCETDDTKTKRELNSLYGKTVYADTDTVKNVSHETLDYADGMKYTE